MAQETSNGFYDKRVYILSFFDIFFLKYNKK